MSAPLVSQWPPAPPLTVASRVTLACVWEATAPKPGNVYRGADFEDLTYVDFLTSAAVAGPALEKALPLGVGRAVLEAIRATRAAVATNTNLGLMLLMAPLAAVPAETPLEAEMGAVLERLDAEDTRMVYGAIRLAHPGGLGSADEADVNDEPPAAPLASIMGMAADRDLVARQYTTGFADVFRVARRIAERADAGVSLSEAVVDLFVEQLAGCCDTLIARKCGQATAAEATRRAAAAWEAREQGVEAYRRALGDLDFWLRADGHRRNPGATADLVGAALFVLLREDRLRWPVRFYAHGENAT